MKQNILLSGLPNEGKGEIFEFVLEQIKGKAQGFTISTIRGRFGFESYKLKTLQGREEVVATRRGGKGKDAGRVDLHAAEFEGIGVEEIQNAITGGKVIVIGEINDVLLRSEIFQRTLIAALKTKRVFAMTGAMEQHRDLFRRIVDAADVKEIEVTPRNKENVKNGILAFFSEES